MPRHFLGDSTPEEVQALKAAFVRLGSLVRAYDAVIADALDKTVEGSANDRARRTARWDAYEMSNLLLFSAQDHLRTIRMILGSGTIPTYSLYTLLRSAAIAVVRCAYLLDPEIDEQLRLARGLNLRWENLDEQNKLKRDEKLFGTRVATLEDSAARNGISVFKKDPNKPATAFGERRMSDVELFSKYVQPLRPEEQDQSAPVFGETSFRFLSGHVHSMLWVNFLNSSAEPTEEPEIATVKLEPHFDIFAGALAAVLRLHEQNLKSFLTLSGYPVIVWKEAVRSGIEHAKAEYVRLAEAQKTT